MRRSLYRLHGAQDDPQNRSKKRQETPARTKAGKPKPWTPEEVEEAFRRFSKASPAPKTELQYVNPVHAAGRGGALRAGDRRRRQQGDARAVRRRRHAGEDGGARRGEGARLHQDHRALSQQGEERGRAVAPARRGARRQVPRDREALEALPGVGRKTANVVLNVAFGEPTIAVDTHIFRVGNRTNMAPGLTPFEVELESREGRAGQIQAARAPLADPARPLHLRRAQAAVRAVRDQRSVPLAGEDRGLDLTEERHARQRRRRLEG